MNKADSERMSGILQTMGYQLAEEELKGFNSTTLVLFVIMLNKKFIAI